MQISKMHKAICLYYFQSDSLCPPNPSQIGTVFELADVFCFTYFLSGFLFRVRGRVRVKVGVGGGFRVRVRVRASVRAR